MAHRFMFVSALLQGSCSCLTPLPCTQPQLSLTTCSRSYCARYQRRPFAMNEMSLHGRDLEGLVGVATGLLASRDISRCRRVDQAGPRPLTSLLLVISSLQISIPAIESPVSYTD